MSNQPMPEENVVTESDINGVLECSATLNGGCKKQENPTV